MGRASTTLAALIALSHFLLSVRWSVLLVVDLVYTGCFVYYFSIHEDGGLAQGLVPTFVALVAFSSAGLYMLEQTQRKLFIAFLDEKTLRVQAEFRASVDLPSPGGSVPRSETSCGVSTTETGNVFATLASGTHSLATLIQMGQKEQWLVDNHDLTVNRRKVLGRGGSGDTFAGRMQRSDVAVKVYSKTICGELNSTVLNELRILRHVRHPNIVLFHGAIFKTSPAEISLVMEMVEGLRYKAFVESLRPWGDCASSWAIQSRALRLLSSALVHLHTRSPGIVHKDLKPDNILVEQRASGPFPKLLDFGLAAVAKRGRAAGGTPGWAAPEVYDAGHQLKATPAMDVYAFGLLVCFTTIGEIVQAQQTNARVLDQLLAVGHEKSRIFERWRPTVRSCLSSQPQERPIMIDVHDLLFSDSMLEHSVETGALTSQQVAPAQAQPQRDSPSCSL